MRALAARLGRAAGDRPGPAPRRHPLPPARSAWAQRLEGRTVIRFARRAKYIECFLDDGAVLLLHLGMSGRLLFDGEPCGAARASHLRLRRRHAPALRRPAPVRHARPVRRPSCWPSIAGSRIWAWSRSTPGFGGRSLAAALAGRRTALKVALMDQRLVVGVGNIYASESLFRARLVAARPAGSLDAARGAAAGQRPSAQVLRGGDRRPAARPCATTSSPTASSATSSATSGSTTARASPARSAAGRCERIVQGARATFFCAVCQR